MFISYTKRFGFRLKMMGYRYPSIQLSERVCGRAYSMKRGRVVDLLDGDSKHSVCIISTKVGS